MEKNYKGPVENSIEILAEKIEKLLSGEYFISKRSIAVLLLQDDEEILSLVKKKESDDAIRQIEKIIREIKQRYVNPISYEIALERQNEVNRISEKVIKVKKAKFSLKDKISRITMNPVVGIPLFILILYFGIYKFVGGIGAGTVVNYIEGVVFEKYLNPFFVQVFTFLIPWETLNSLIIGEYGILTLGLRYAVAIILPIVSFFFFVFSIIEDSGYLPRLAMLIDRTFKKLGLSGRAVIPMVLGFGCDTMATMVTRILPTKREKIISTILLALAVPCSAQLGIILALLEGFLKGMIIWVFVISLIFVLIGYLSSKILPGEKPSFYMEIPPLRIPSIFNILTKTYIRVKWYFKEVLPLFAIASTAIWIGKISGIFDFAVKLLRYPVMWIGLPSDASKVFLFGFFRRDYGAAWLYDMNKAGLLTKQQLVVACIALTLFLPCIAQFLMNVKERGWKIGLAISFFVFVFAFLTAYAVNFILSI